MRKLSERNRARRERERFKRGKVSGELGAKLNRAKHVLAPVMALANGQTPVRAAAWLRRSFGDDHDPGKPRDVLGGVNEARHLLQRWSRERVGQLIRGIAVEAEYYVTKSGGIKLGAKWSAGSIRQLVALSIGEARAILLEKFEERVQQCDNPRCRKWYFYGGLRSRHPLRQRSRGESVNYHCCRGCGNLHQQLKRAAGYKKRRANGEYIAEPCCRCS